MPVHFPKVEDIPLGRSPLSEVICQVRFPPILVIAEREPSAFQDRIRGMFPFYEVDQRFVLRMESISGQPAAGAEVASRAYRFLSLDRQSIVTLSTDFVALTTSHYTVWDDFRSDLSLVHQAITDVYAPLVATRIGLRYINDINYENSGCKNLEELAGILRPELTQLVMTDAWREPTEMLSQVILGDDPARIVIRSVFNHQMQPTRLLLDIDCFEEGRLSTGQIIPYCDRYHDLIYSAFRWSLGERGISPFHPKDRRIAP